MREKETKRREDFREEIKWFQKRGLVIVLVGMVILWFFGPNLTTSGVVTLEVAMIQLNGFLLAFVSIAFTGMVAEVRSRTDIDLEERKKLSKQIRLASLYGFVYLVFALIFCTAILNLALTLPANSLVGVYLAEYLPLVFTVLGMAMILLALFQFARMD